MSNNEYTYADKPYCPYTYNGNKTSKSNKGGILRDIDESLVDLKITLKEYK